jgi:hypothetical protein
MMPLSGHADCCLSSVRNILRVYLRLFEESIFLNIYKNTGAKFNDRIEIRIDSPSSPR